MILTTDTFVCKPGNASKLAKMFKESMATQPGGKYVLTDMTGQWHRVIMVSEFDSLTDYDKKMEEMMKNPTEAMKKDMEKYKDMNDMYVSGSREIYKVW